MKKVGSATVLAGGLACITLSVLLSAQFLGFLHDPQTAADREAARVCQLTAAQTVPLVEARRFAELDRLFSQLRQADTPIRSAAFRSADGKLLASAPGHEQRWEMASKNDGLRQVTVPLLNGEQERGRLELLLESRLAGPVLSLGLLTVYIVAACLLLFLVYVKRVLRYIDPSSVISDRVRNMLDTLAEGVLVIDAGGSIVMANDTLGRITGQAPERLQGVSIAKLPWKTPGQGPWQQALSERKRISGCEVTLVDAEGGDRLLRMNCSPILGDGGKLRGLLVTCDDITAIEQKNIELRHANEQIERQNRELQLLATTDPLTGCLNRRAFFANAEGRWNRSQRYQKPVACLMFDIDFFKKINDTHGHATGDKVLADVGRVLRDQARGDDIVCRYGGEEFCVLLQEATIEDAEQAAERFRVAVVAAKCGGIHVTASLGVSSSQFGAADVGRMLEQADQALYASKHNGRNRVTRFDRLPAPKKRDAA